MNAGKDAVEALLAAPRADAERLVREMSAEGIARFAFDWPSWVHEGQEAPCGDEWAVWVLLGGRGFGKTRAGAEWVSAMVRAHPGAWIALVAATAEEARALMVEGRSGLIAVARPEERKQMCWEPSRRLLTFASGATARIFSGAQADGLRGFEHHFAWCDELAKWKQAQGAWDNLMLGLRLGERPRALVTTTPKPVAALKAIIGGEGAVRSGGAARANPHVSERALDALERRLGGTRLGRQELGGEMIEEVAGALWSRELIERSRVAGPLHHAAHGSPPRPGEDWRRVVVGVDPPAGSDGDACGIVVCGLGEDGIGYVIADHSVGGLSPEGWARKAGAAAEAHGAQRLVAEANNGGKMVEAVLRGAGLRFPVRLVHAAEGKAARAEPVAALFESGQAKLAGRFPELEDEMAGLTYGGRYEGPGRSPDRADAMVWAMTELMLAHRRSEPRVRGLWP